MRYVLVLVAMVVLISGCCKKQCPMGDKKPCAMDEMKKPCEAGCTKPCCAGKK